ncbi:hypothetical protein BJY01DRAFT_256403 [Aspergillus pseudoustus]|uniref:F-box domain-containing protein n=1 Tax=Aspergillus pseudoustus TaxID=1810923 RepID=A0ABR4IAP7_9EURO
MSLPPVFSPYSADHALVGGLKVPETGRHTPDRPSNCPRLDLTSGLQLADSTVSQESSLMELPIELIIASFDTLRLEPVAQTALSMSCKKLLQISSTTTLLSCCLKPGSSHRTLLSTIGPRINNNNTSRISPAWHICQPCGKLKPTSAAYWAAKRNDVRYEDDGVPQWLWNVGVRNFTTKKSAACLNCEVAHWRNFLTRLVNMGLCDLGAEIGAYR